MKKITHWVVLLSCLTIATNLFAFTKSLSPFDEIILSGNVSALLVEGEEESIDIKNDADRLDFYIDGKSLKVKATDLVQFNSTPTIKVIITYKKLRGLKVRAGASAYTDDSINGDALELRFSTGASGEIEVMQSSLDINVSEGGNLKLSGQTDWQDIKVATGGTLSAYKLNARNSIVRANTGGSAKIMTTESVDARANTGGSIIYKGDPQKVQQKDGLSGTVKSW